MIAALVAWTAIAWTLYHRHNSSRAKGPEDKNIPVNINYVFGPNDAAATWMPELTYLVLTCWACSGLSCRYTSSCVFAPRLDAARLDDGLTKNEQVVAVGAGGSRADPEDGDGGPHREDGLARRRWRGECGSEQDEGPRRPGRGRRAQSPEETKAHGAPRPAGPGSTRGADAGAPPGSPQHL